MIIEKFGWTWDYLLWGVPYPTVQKMLADAPWVDYKKTDSSGEPKQAKTKTTTLRDLINSQIK